MALPVSLFLETLARCSRNHLSSTMTSDRLRSLRTRTRSCGVMPLISRSIDSRREGGEPRPLCYLPDGGGRHRTANVPRDFAAHRGATAAATTSASVRRSISCIQQQLTEGVRPNSGKMARSDPRPSVRVTRGAGSGQYLVSVLQEGWENANIDACLGFIWRISVKEWRAEYNEVRPHSATPALASSNIVIVSRQLVTCRAH